MIGSRLKVSVLLALLLSMPSAVFGQSAEEALRRMQAEADSAISARKAASEETLREWRRETRAALQAWARRGSGGGGTSAPSREAPATDRAPSSSGGTSGSTEASIEETGPSGENKLSSTASEPSPSPSAVPASRRERAQPYLQLIRRGSQDRGVPPTLALAIVDAESSFDPRAISSEGAVGLMQIHPPSGGKLAYSVLHGEARRPSEAYLKDPENNVELGTTLLAMLLNRGRFFKEVQSPWSRQLLATAAYNCGATCVARRFTEEESLGATVALANSFTPRQVYEKLQRTLPPETRTYVRRVFTRRSYYRAWRGAGERVYGVPPPQNSE